MCVAWGRLLAERPDFPRPPSARAARLVPRPYKRWFLEMSLYARCARRIPDIAGPFYSAGGH